MIPKRQQRALGMGRLWKRQGAWCADWKDADGSRHRRILSTDKRVAERKLAEIIRQRDLVACGLAVEDGLDLGFDDIVAEYLADLRSRRSKRYADRCEGILNRIGESLGLQTLRDLRPQALLLYRRTRVGDGAANRTVNMELGVVKTMLNWTTRAGYIAFNPVQAVQGLPAGKGYEKRPRRAMTDDEVERFLAAAAAMDEERSDRALALKSIENRGGKYAAVERVPRIPQAVMWQALLETGARFGETVTATWADFSLERATLRLRASTTKSRKERTIPLRRELADTIAALRFVHHRVLGRIPAAADRIFLSPRGATWAGARRRALTRFEQTLERAGIEKVDASGEVLSIHSLRHTAASRWARAGVPLQKAQALLGHSDPALTARIYTHLGTEDLRDAVQAVGQAKSRASGVAKEESA